MERLIVLDTETTGIKVEEEHRIIEIGCCEILDRQITNSEFHEYIQPERLVGDSVRIHNITDKFLMNKPKFEYVAEEFLDYIKGSTLIIHNAPFDLGFLNHELKLMGTEETIEQHCKIIDTLKLSKEQRPTGLHNLNALSRRFEVDIGDRTFHGALLDSQILARVYLAMTGGQSDLCLNANDAQNTIQETHPIIRFDKNRKPLKITKPTPEEEKEHQEYIDFLTEAKEKRLKKEAKEAEEKRLEEELQKKQKLKPN
jgi:DNA polymerase-3 subunit epsilon